MAEWLALVLVAGALYLLECLIWVEAAASACIRTPPGFRWRAIQGASLPGNERGGVAMINPAAPGGGIVVCRRWPFSVSPDGLSNLVPDGEPGTRGGSTYIPFDEVRSVRAELGDVYVNGARFVRAGSSALAAHLAEQIRRIKACAAGERAAAITAALQASCDERTAEDAWRELMRRTRVLRAAGAGLLGFLFVLSPLVLVAVGPLASWPYLLAGIYLMTAAIVAAFVRVHAALYPDCGYDRWMHALSMLLLPVAAARCVDKLSRDVLCRFSPAVVLPLMGGAACAAPVLREQLIDLRTDAEGPNRTGEWRTPGAECARWFSQQLLAQADAAAQRLLVPVFQPPAREQETTSYCSRCHAQYRRGSAGAPSACCGAPLASFAESAAAAS